MVSFGAFWVALYVIYLLIYWILKETVVTFRLMCERTTGCICPSYPNNSSAVHSNSSSWTQKGVFRPCNMEMEARNIYGISAATATVGHGMPLWAWAGLRQYLLRLIYDCYIEQESGSKSRVRALTRDPTRSGPKLMTRWPADRRPGSISATKCCARCPNEFKHLKTVFMIILCSMSPVSCVYVNS